MCSAEEKGFKSAVSKNSLKDWLDNATSGCASQERHSFDQQVKPI